MKNIIIKSFLTALFVIGITTFTTLNAQDVPPPPPPANGGQGGNVPGGGAPIGEGLLILSLLGAGYGTKKWYSKHKKKIAE
jgi:hypothetical protein